jgi:hypothetical protein
MKKNLQTSVCLSIMTALVWLIALSGSQAQVVTINTAAATSGISTFGSSTYAAGEYIYTDTEIGATNFTTAGTEINRIGIFSTVVGTPTAFNNVTIYFKNVPAATTTFAQGTYTTTGYTQVFSGTVNVTATGATYINLTTPFLRTAGTNLQMLIERNENVAHTGFTWQCSNGNSTAGVTALTCRRYNGTIALSGATILATSAFRSSIELQHLYPNDASVRQVYTLGKLPIPYATPHAIRANITNAGLSALSNVNVTLNVTGANTFTDVQTIPSLAVGASATVSFANFTPTVIGTNTVTVSTPPDDFNGNNSSAVTQTVSGNAYTYAYGTTSSGGVGFNGATGDFVAKFNTSSATTVNQVNVTFTSGGNAYKIGIWDATGTAGAPGTLLWESAALTTATGVATITVPYIAVNGGFFVGVRQTGTVNVGFGYQIENPIRSGTFYFTSPTGGTTWTDFAPANSFRFMVEPKLTLSDDIGVANIVTPVSASDNEFCAGAITPTANVSNFGVNNKTNVGVTFTIKQGATTVYTNTQTIPTLNTGVTQLVTFAPATLPVGVYTVECTTALTGDLDATNDLKTIGFNIINSYYGAANTYNFANAIACAGTPIIAPTYSWIAPAATEVTWSGGLGDDNIQQLTLPFGFSYYGTVYNSIWVSSNGWASFTDPSALTTTIQRTPVTIPTAGGIENYIAGVFKDLDMTPATYTDAHLYYGGDASQFVMTWFHAHNIASTTDYVTFQIILTPDGSIKIQYNDAETTSPLPIAITNGSVIGIENSTGTQGIRYRFGTAGGPMFGSPTMAVLFRPVTPIPITLLSFEAKSEKGQNQLLWRSANEQNISHFVLQRSADGVRFVDLGNVKANNVRGVSEYRFADVTPLANDNYYRLKIMESDGKYEFSDIRWVNAASAVTQFKVYPNPTNDNLTASFESNQSGQCTLQVYDIFGKLVLSQTADCQLGNNRYVLALGQLAKGIYVVKIASNEAVLSTAKFTKM